jgi:hypothetical protein
VHQVGPALERAAELAARHHLLAGVAALLEVHAAHRFVVEHLGHKGLDHRLAQGGHAAAHLQPVPQRRCRAPGRRAAPPRPVPPTARGRPRARVQAHPVARRRRPACSRGLWGQAAHRHWPRPAVQLEVGAGVAELGFGAQHEHGQALERGRQQVAWQTSRISSWLRLKPMKLASMRPLAEQNAARRASTGPAGQSLASAGRAGTWRRLRLVPGSRPDGAGSDTPRGAPGVVESGAWDMVGRLSCAVPRRAPASHAPTSPAVIRLFARLLLLTFLLAGLLAGGAWWWLGQPLRCRPRPPPNSRWRWRCRPGASARGVAGGADPGGVQTPAWAAAGLVPPVGPVARHQGRHLRNPAGRHAAQPAGQTGARRAGAAQPHPGRRLELPRGDGGGAPRPT